MCTIDNAQTYIHIFMYVKYTTVFMGARMTQIK